MRTVLTALLALVFLVPVAAFADAPVAVAVDASRSLSATELDAIRLSLQAAIEELPGDAQVGVIVFNDEARWLTRPTADRAAVHEGLASIQPEGNFTVLNDALFLAARELDDGGVILVVTDGRDENSATTVEDVATLSVENHVRVVAVSSGRWVDERALRRLALLTSGAYLGALNGTDPSALAEAVSNARQAVAEEVAAAAPPPVESRAVDRPIQVAEPVVPASTTSAGILPWAVALLLAVILAAVLWRFLGRRGGAGAADRTCERCDSPMEAWETSCSSCAMADLGDVVNSTSVAAKAIPVEVAEEPPKGSNGDFSDESVLDPAVFDKQPLPFNLENTMVLNEQPVLEIKQRGKRPKTYTLPKDETFAVGRAPEVNTVQLEDPTISGQHFKVVPKEDDFYVVDLGTTNGTQVNHERVKVKKLQPGDVISVGQVEFEFKMKVRRVS